MDIEIEAIRTMIHEMKNSLAALVIQWDMIKDQLSPELQYDYESMTREIDRLTRLANNMSDFIKNPLGNPQKIELVGFIKEMSSLFKQPVKFSGNVGKVSVLFDTDRARSVFENLIKNACESSSSGKPEVEVSIDSDGFYVTVRVMDRGDGIKECDMAKLFDPCFTTKPQGSGVGLSVSKQFVSAQGGNLKLYPRDGGGTVAEVRIKQEI